MNSLNPPVDPIRVLSRDNLTEKVYRELRGLLMGGHFWPGHRFKIRALAVALGVSETPVREAMMQLVREKGVEVRAGRSFCVAELNLRQYLELREIRLHLEGLAVEKAARNIPDAEIEALASVHATLAEAEKSRDWQQAVRANWLFHHLLFQHADMPELLDILETIWLRNGPLINYQYPHAPPTYHARHQHLNVLDALRARRPDDARLAIQADLIEGGHLLVGLLERLGRGVVTQEELRTGAERGTEPHLQSVPPRTVVAFQ